MVMSISSPFPKPFVNFVLSDLVIIPAVLYQNTKDATRCLNSNFISQFEGRT
jgi:hypothetical protein